MIQVETLKQEKIEIMTWHKELNLNVPQTLSASQKLSSHSDLDNNTIVASSSESTAPLGEPS